MAKPHLKHLSDEALEEKYSALLNERLRRKTIIRDKLYAILVSNNQYVADHASELLNFTQHCPIWNNECNDENPSGFYRRCPRCVLLRVQKEPEILHPVLVRVNKIKFVLDVRKLEDNDP